MTEIPIATVKRLMKGAGAKRVSDGAAITLAEIAETFIIEISEDAVKAANHAGRKTVQSIDIDMALN